jgi:hypothetical protein
MTKPHSIYINLTAEQAALLEQHFAYVRDQASRGERGMLVAQVWAGNDDSPASMRVGFIENGVAKTIEHAASG